ncbi:membrane protein [Desulfosporosinus acidiphilus]|uniref:membrane protein n=1 Tax=Desulfosporosinus acidiphilus TaxID=885581 RepID=UPI000257B0D3|nr:membrane protein [Desulfosporosinus acidiphilus]
MYVISTFEHSNYLELAITAIQMKGIAKENILCVPLDKKSEDKKLFDTIHSADGLSLIDFPIILATISCLFGGIYGFILAWGPIMWGIIGMCVGFSVGLVIKLITTRKYNRQKKSKSSEVVVIIDCNDKQLDMIKNTLWEHNALGVSKLSLDNNI